MPKGVAQYVRHFDVRMSSPDPGVRLRVLTELTYFHPRDSVLYPPFLRRLLKDASPKIRWQTIARLDEHGIRLAHHEIPSSFEVPLIGLLVTGDEDSRANFREYARGGGPSGGWTIRALGVIGDKSSLSLAEAMLNSDNVFVRYSAAVALTQLGRMEQGKEQLKLIAKTQGDRRSKFYQWSAAERLFRLGEKEYIKVLFNHVDPKSSSAYGAIEILEDLTGEYFLSREAWETWWNREGRAKHMEKSKGLPSH